MITARIYISEVDMRTRNASTMVRRYDVEVNQFCRDTGSIATYNDWHWFEIDARSNFAAGCGLQFTRSMLTLNGIDLLPPSTTIKFARLTLFGYEPNNFVAYSFDDEEDVSNEILIKRILTKWNVDTVTWKTQSNTTDINAAVIPSTKPTFPNIAHNTVLYNFTIDITQLARDIQSSGPQNNHGVMLQMKEERRYRAMAFCSFRHPDEKRHPQLIIET